jgi:hypothetical protein
MSAATTTRLARPLRENFPCSWMNAPSRLLKWGDGVRHGATEDSVEIVNRRNTLRNATRYSVLNK